MAAAVVSSWTQNLRPDHETFEQRQPEDFRMSHVNPQALNVSWCYVITACVEHKEGSGWWSSDLVYFLVFAPLTHRHRSSVTFFDAAP